MNGYILAGGKSSRMGEDKGLLLFRGKPLVLHLIEEMKEYVDHIIILTNQLEDYAFLQEKDVSLKEDCIKGKGPLGGIYTGLLEEDGFFISCDLPFFRGEMIPLMEDAIGENWGCFPFEDSFFEPLCGIYRQKMLPIIEQRIEDNELRLQTLLQFFDNKGKLEKIGKKKLMKDYGEEIFLNMNTKEIYDRLSKEGN